MGRDIRVESKHFVHSGSKSSDLLMAFDIFFSHFPEYGTGDDVYFNINLTRSDMKRVLDFVRNNSGIYRDADELLEKINNIYIRMMPKDLVEVDIH